MSELRDEAKALVENVNTPSRCRVVIAALLGVLEHQDGLLIDTEWKFRKAEYNYASAMLDKISRMKKERDNAS